METYPLPERDPSTGYKTSLIGRILRTLGVDLPAEILAGPAAAGRGEAVARIAAVSEPPRDPLADAVAAVLRGEDPEPHLIRAAAWAQYPALVAAVEESSRNEYVGRLNANADRIIRAVREQIFGPALDELRDLIDQFPDALWNERVAAELGDYESAQRARENRPIAQRLASCIELREALHPGAFDDEAAWATEPGALQTEPEPASLAWWVALIGQGIEPDYPTIREWTERRDSEEFAGPEPEPLVSRGWVTRD